MGEGGESRSGFREDGDNPRPGCGPLRAHGRKVKRQKGPRSAGPENARFQDGADEGAILGGNGVHPKGDGRL